MKLFIFTRSFPYDGAKEQSFLRKEIDVLKLHFDSIVIIPQDTDGHLYDLPEGVFHDDTLAERLKRNKSISKLLLYLDSKLIIELLCNIRTIFSLRALRNMLSYGCASNIIREWVTEYIRKESLELDKCVFYTYWNDVATLGIARSKTVYQNLCLASRAHGIDLYEERHPCAYIPFRKFMIPLADALFPDSEAGNEYLLKK